MTGIPARYYRVCDRCGEIVSITSDDSSEFVCSECGSRSAWEFPLHVKALDMQRQIRDNNERTRGVAFGSAHRRIVS